MKPGKNDHYTKKVNGGKIHVQKRYLLWPLRDILDMLNGSNISVSDSFKDVFEKELSFTLFYKFIKARNQYIFNLQNLSEHLSLSNLRKRILADSGFKSGLQEINNL